MLSFASLVPHFINTTTFAARDFRPRRGASDAHTLQGSVRREQRRLGRKEPSPAGLRRFSVLALLLLGHSPTAGDAPSSRLARTENRRNKRGRIYEMGYLGRQRFDHLTVRSVAMNSTNIRLVVAYAAALLGSLWLGYQLRFDFAVPEETERTFLLVFGWVVSFKFFCLWRFRQINVLPDYFSLPDFSRLFR